ncbi:MAG: HEAT repeat domain-containing protein [Sandaracinaceae bacterium]|nr:HEAT repeat domain-containing protein [Sandaracinaceae bacterium]
MSQDIPPVPPPLPESDDVEELGLEMLDSLPPVPPAPDEVDSSLDPFGAAALAAPALPGEAPPNPLLAVQRSPSPLGGAPLGGGMTLGEEDDRSIEKIGTRTTKSGRLIVGAMVAALIAIGGWAFVSRQHHEDRFERLEEIGRMEDREAMLAALRAYLPEAPYDDVKERVLANLGHFRDAEAVPAIIGELHNGGVVRRAAARALAQIGLPAAESAKGPLFDVLADTDERDRAQVVWTLALLREERAADAVLEMFMSGRLQALDDFSPDVVVAVLGTERLGTDALIRHDSESVRVLTAHALAEGRGTEVVEPLTRMLSAELERPAPTRDSTEGSRSPEVIRAVTAGLGRTGDARAARPLFNVLNAHRDLRASVLESLRQSASGTQLAVLAREASDRDLLLDLVKMMARTHDPRVADNLAGFLAHADEEIRTEAAFGLAELEDPRAAGVLVAVARTGVGRADDAFGALRYVASAEVAAPLRELLEHRPARRADILRAMGRSGDASFGSFLIEQLEETDAGAAALALADLDYTPGFVQLRRLSRRPGNLNMGTTGPSDRSLATQSVLDARRSALMGLGAYGRSEIVDDMIVIVEDGQDDYELREIAAANIGMVATDEQMAAIFTKILDASLSLPSRKNYAAALWQRSRPALNARMLELAGNQEVSYEIRRAASLAVGYAANPESDAALIAMLDNRESERGAAMAIALGGGPAAVTHLMEKLVENRELAQILQEAVLSEERGWFSLITEDMAQGALWRRLRTAAQLRAGLSGSAESYSYAWNKVLDVMRNGWSGPGGASRAYIRGQLWNAVQSEDAPTRQLAARAMRDLPERGLLLRARDTEGVASEAAREQLAEELRAETNEE